MLHRAIVSGAGGALGHSVVECFLAQGWFVHALVRNPNPEGRWTSNHLYSEHLCDLSNENECSEVVSSIDEFSAVVHLVGGIEAGTSIVESNSELFTRMLTINLMSAFNLLHATMPQLQRRAGCFVGIGAASALRPTPNRAAYSASKAALISLCLSAAEEGRVHGFRANVVVPGILRTAANLEWAQNGEEQNWTDPLECAEAIVALCGPSMKSLNGAVLPMFGGLSF